MHDSLRNYVSSREWDVVIIYCTQNLLRFCQVATELGLPNFSIHTQCFSDFYVPDRLQFSLQS